MQPGAEAGQPKIHSPGEEKRLLRIKLQADRRSRDEVAAARTARTARTLAACAGAEVVACYASRADEPDTSELVDALWQSGVQVLLPVITSGADWAWHAGPGTLIHGRANIYQPPGPGLGQAALGVADWIWLPGLAGTPDGHRLGTGGGWYDRALRHARPDARRGLILFDDEVLNAVPTEPWDQPVDLLVTERRRIDCPRGIPTPVSEL
jgi:5-formyltetrahydrofolate cyclo-ligase